MDIHVHNFRTSAVVQCKENILKFGVQWRKVRKTCIFQLITNRISKAEKDRAKVAINQ